MPQPYTIARLAAAAGVHVETVRYYQRRKLIPEPKRPAGGVRRYGDADVERLRFIRRAQTMGFTLTDVHDLLRLRSSRSCHETRELAAGKLRIVDDRIREMRRLRKQLAEVIADCDANTEDALCPLMERLSAGG